MNNDTRWLHWRLAAAVSLIANWRNGPGWLSLALIALAVLMPTPAIRGQIRLQRSNDSVEVTTDGELFARYCAECGNQPVIWPIIGPSNIEMTRGFPMRDPLDGEATDHPHQRSMWFAHGDVNGVDFWLEPAADNKKKRGFGKIVHQEFVSIEEGDVPEIVTRNAWINSEGEKLLTDHRTVGFGADAQRRWIDFDIRLVNDGDQTVTFGDTKEGCFGMRVASWMAVGDGKGGKIINSLGTTNKDAWGKAASWVDYHASYEGQTMGIAILNHPSSFRFPTYWHVRTYGLFAANVFGLHNFKNSEDEDGSYQLQPGDSIQFYYRVLLHNGDEQEGRVPESFVDYAKIDKSAIDEAELDALISEEPAEVDESAPKLLQPATHSKQP